MSTKPEIYISQGVIASWLGVTGAAVSNWITSRYAGKFPSPDAVIVSPGGGETPGWLPSRRKEIEDWNRERLSRSHSTKPHGRYVTEAERQELGI